LSHSLCSSLDQTLSSPASLRGKSLKFVRGETLGRGSLGNVFKALNQETGVIFAAKEVLFNHSDPDDLKFKAALENEISICKDLKHPRIVSYLGHDSIDGCLFIFLEYMPGGSVAQVLKQFGPFDESLITRHARELLEGLEYLHTREPPVIHRDIKGANVLVGLDCRVKFSDFGCSKRTNDTMSHTMKGSIPWMAPEVIQSTGAGRKADIWSFGCLCLEMASETRMPWGTRFDNPLAAMFRIGMSQETPPIPDFFTELCRDFVGLCVQRDPVKRPTAEELLQHELVRDILVEE